MCMYPGLYVPWSTHQDVSVETRVHTHQDVETRVHTHQDVSVDMNAHAFSMDLCVCMCGWVGVFVRAGVWLGD